MQNAAEERRDIQELLSNFHGAKADVLRYLNHELHSCDAAPLQRLQNPVAMEIQTV